MLKGRRSRRSTSHDQSSVASLETLEKTGSKFKAVTAFAVVMNTSWVIERPPQEREDVGGFCLRMRPLLHVEGSCVFWTGGAVGGRETLIIHYGLVAVFPVREPERRAWRLINRLLGSSGSNTSVQMCFHLLNLPLLAFESSE